MANEVLTKVGGQLRFIAVSGFSPVDVATDWTIGAPTDVLLTLSGIVNDAGRQSTKIDLGATRAPEYELLGCIDFTGVTPTIGSTVDYYWAPSTHNTDANGNVAGNSGVDAAAPGGALGSISLPEFITQCQFIGSLILHDGSVPQNGLVGRFSPTGRYGQLIIVNKSGVTFETDNVESHQVMNPIITEIQ
jgi:hypothetical protein